MFVVVLILVNGFYLRYLSAYIKMMVLNRNFDFSFITIFKEKFLGIIKLFQFYFYNAYNGKCSQFYKMKRYKNRPEVVVKRPRDG